MPTSPLALRSYMLCPEPEITWDVQRPVSLRIRNANGEEIDIGTCQHARVTNHGVEVTMQVDREHADFMRRLMDTPNMTSSVSVAYRGGNMPSGVIEIDECYPSHMNWEHDFDRYPPQMNVGFTSANGQVVVRDIPEEPQVVSTPVPMYRLPANMKGELVAVSEAPTLSDVQMGIVKMLHASDVAAADRDAIYEVLVADMLGLNTGRGAR